MARAFRVPFAFFPSFLLVSLFLHFYDSCNIARAGNWLMDPLRSIVLKGLNGFATLPIVHVTAIVTD
ncbi:hypothetical protein BFJ70_g13550 [Fusarium oxysporum]|nr:hypothetical protein BFJ66_g6245 [Fusarium oxysporum f. sp. cepae]RKL20840.1 hypothetical protein BFJ70_g13550 [Fusarium oxysporum]